jgi:uncharacterized repeat protein (TIGR01451 family)
MIRTKNGRNSLVRRVRRLPARPGVEAMEPRVLLANVVVVSTSDDGSSGTLRWAIQQVNADSAAGSIRFNIPGSGLQVISITQPLPALSATAVIDGTSQPNYAGQPLIQIDGTKAGSACDGLVISGSDSVVKGLAITNFSGSGLVLEGSNGNLVQAMVVGANPTGRQAQPNGEGIEISGSSSNTIGGTAAGAENVISGNLGNGIEIVEGAQSSNFNLIEGNLIGTTGDGASPLGNGGSGILIGDTSGNMVGGTDQGAGNVISANGRHGVVLSTGATAIVIEGNLIGTTADGSSGLGNQHDGIYLDGATGNTIGGADPRAGNVISGNGGHGIETAHAATSNLVSGNFIGTDRSGLIHLGNGGNGVTLGSSDNSIGALTTGAGNTIAYNGTGRVGAGVQLVGLVRLDTILSNSIHDNAGLGINLGNGPTPNQQPGTPGPNDFQNYPVLSAVQTDGKTTSITGTLLGLPNASYLIQVFDSPSADPSGFGQGQTLLDTFAVTTDNSGNAPFILSAQGVAVPGSFISATATDSLGNTSEFCRDIVSSGIVDLGVSIVATPNPVASGGLVTYQVSVRNSSPLDAHNVVLSDVAPLTVHVVSATSSQGSPPMVMGQNIIAHLGTLAANSSATMTVVVQVMASAGATLTDTATVTLQETDPNPANNTATVTTRVAPTADLALSASETASTVRVGDSVGFSLTVTNQGPSAAPNVILVLPLGSGLGFTSASATQGSTTFAGGQLTASLGTLVVGGQATVTLSLVAHAAGTSSSTATVSSDDADPTPANNTATISVVIQPVVDLHVAITATPAPAAVGGNLVYAVTTTNSGPSDASSVSLSDVLPTGATFISASSDTGSPPVVTSGTLSAAIGALPVGATATVLITVQCAVPAGSMLLDSASATAAENQSNPADSSASLSVPVRDVSNLTLAMTPSVSTIPIGQHMTYSLVVTNSGPTAEPDAVITIPMPSTVALLSASSSQGPAPVGGSGSMTADLGAMPVGSSATVTLVASPLAAALGTLTMSASVAGYNADLEPAEAQASASVTVAPAAGLSIALSPQAALAYQGADLTYTLSVSNAGPSDASSVIVSSPLPAGVAFVTALSSQGAAPVFGAGQVEAALGTIPANKSATLTIVVIPAQVVAAPGLPLAGSVTEVVFDPNQSSSSASAALPVLPSDDLSASLSSSQPTGEVGKTVTLTATVANGGPSGATGVVLQLPLAAGALVTSVSAPGSQTQVQSGLLTIQIGNLPVGASSTFTIGLEPMIAGSDTWTASVSGIQNDLQPGNNQATATVLVGASPGILQFSTGLTAVNDTAGVAAISVVRSLGARGPVSVHYQTFGGNAVPGLDYTATSGTLTFADGQTVQTILVPVLDNPYDRHDELVGLSLDSPAGGAVLGTMTTTMLQIHDTDPDLTPPQVTSLTWNGPPNAITSIVLSFTAPLTLSTALNPAAYQIVDLGMSGLASPPGAVPLGFAQPSYDASARSVTLVPLQPLVAGHFYRIQVSGSGTSAVEDLAGNLLAGASPGAAGTDYIALIGRGTTLKYVDQSGDMVTLKVSGGGYLDDIRSATGDGLVLRLEGGVRHKTTISGTVARVKGHGAGRTSLGTIEGLGNFGDIRITLKSPPFFVKQYPFSVGRARFLGVKPPAPAPPPAKPEPKLTTAMLRPSLASGKRIG